MYRHPPPIVLFAYNRPWHLRQTLEALRRNHLAESSRLIVYSDGPRNEWDRDLVKGKDEIHCGYYASIPVCGGAHY